MAGLEADISSYNQPLPVGPLDMASKLGSLQQQNQQIQSGAITIDKQKLDLMSQQFGIMNNELANIADSNLTKPQAAERMARISKTLNLPPAATTHMMEELQQAPDVKSFAMNAMRRGMDTMQKYGVQIGTNETQQDNKNVFQGVRQSPEKGGGFAPATRLPVQIAPGTPGYDQNNQQQFEQPSGPSGVTPVPRARPALPAQRPTMSGATGPTVETTGGPNSPPATIAQRSDVTPSAPLRAGPSPMFPEGKEAYTKDQLLAGGKAQAIKPAIQALKLMPGIMTGPGTDQLNNAVAALKGFGLVDIKAENDPTVARQELEKKLAQYVGSNPIGQRSDAQQVLAEAGSPNPKKQILPALQALTRDAIALDRVQILKPQAFKGSDYQNYIKHQGTFPGGIDEKALTLDLLPEKDRGILVAKMKKDYKDGDPNAKKKATRFFETVDLAREHKIYESD